MRVIILGPGAAGKSTFVRRLSDATGVRSVELDTVFWSNALEPLSPTQWVTVQTELIAGESWILDGDLGPHDMLPTRLERADTVVIFDVPPVICAWRALRRSRAKWEFWVWMLTWRRREKPQILAAIGRHAPAAEVKLVTNDGDAARLLAEMS